MCFKITNETEISEISPNWTQIIDPSLFSICIDRPSLYSPVLLPVFSSWARIFFFLVLFALCLCAVIESAETLAGAWRTWREEAWWGFRLCSSSCEGKIENPQMTAAKKEQNFRETWLCGGPLCESLSLWHLYLRSFTKKDLRLHFF